MPRISGYSLVWNDPIRQQAISGHELAEVIHQEDFVQTGSCFASFGCGNTGIKYGDIQQNMIIPKPITELMNAV